MGVATTVPLALALAAALPGDAAAPRVFLAVAGLVAWSLLLLTLTSTWVSAYTAIIVVSASVAIAAAVRILAHLPYLTLGCGLIAISLLVALNAPTASAVWARYPLPNVPAPDEITPPPLALAEIEDLPRKAATSNAYQSGLIAASVILGVIGSVLVVWIPAAPSLLAWWLMLATIAVTLLRMRIWDSAVPALWFLSAPFLTALALSVAFALNGHMMAAIYAAAALAGLTMVLLLAAVLKPRELTIPQRRYLDFFENTLLATILPAMLLLVGLVGLIRNRGAL
jgi:type VII secretion integral membrane protein EccD